MKRLSWDDWNAYLGGCPLSPSGPTVIVFTEGGSRLGLILTEDREDPVPKTEERDLSRTVLLARSRPAKLLKHRKRSQRNKTMADNGIIIVSL